MSSQKQSDRQGLKEIPEQIVGRYTALVEAWYTAHQCPDSKVSPVLKQFEAVVNNYVSVCDEAIQELYLAESRKNGVDWGQDSIGGVFPNTDRGANSIHQQHTVFIGALDTLGVFLETPPEYTDELPNPDGVYDMLTDFGRIANPDSVEQSRKMVAFQILLSEKQGHIGVWEGYPVTDHRPGLYSRILASYLRAV
jgi:hypothetical protein